MICPNCNKPTMILKDTDPMDAYYNKNAPKNRAKCASCHASFENYDNGAAKRTELRETEIKERETLKRLVKKYGVPKDDIERQVNREARTKHMKND
jgi:transcriptional regulator NrdR family protein